MDYNNCSQIQATKNFTLKEGLEKQNSIQNYGVEM